MVLYTKRDKGEVPYILGSKLEEERKKRAKGMHAPSHLKDSQKLLHKCFWLPSTDMSGVTLLYILPCKGKMKAAVCILGILVPGPRLEILSPLGKKKKKRNGSWARTSWTPKYS